METLKQDSFSSTKEKHIIDCQSRIYKDKTTNGWLDSLDFIKTTSIEKANMSHKKILQGILDKNKHVVVKISDKKEDIKYEFDVFTKLHENNINGIIHYFCYFECNGNINKFNPLCTGDGDSTRILLMEYVKNKNMAEYRWKDNLMILSCIKQTILCVLEAYLKVGFVHNDLHFKNVLIKKTKSKEINYNINDEIIKIEIPENGFKIKLMDFEFSKFNQKPVMFWKDIKFNLIKSIVSYFNIDFIETEIQTLIRKYFDNEEKDVTKVLELLPILDKHFKSSKTVLQNPL
jgi:serine/threonine protein kinase